MGKVVAQAIMSLDGYVAKPDNSAAAGHRRYVVCRTVGCLTSALSKARHVSRVKEAGSAGPAAGQRAGSVPSGRSAVVLRWGGSALVGCRPWCGCGVDGEQGEGSGAGCGGGFGPATGQVESGGAE